MKLYFCETTYRDYSRVGYDDVFIDCSLSPYDSEEGSNAASVWYSIEISDSYTSDEAMKLGGKAISLAQNEGISVSEAIMRIDKKTRRKHNEH